MLEQSDCTSATSRFTEEVRSGESIKAADSNLSSLSIPSRALSRILFALLPAIAVAIVSGEAQIFSSPRVISKYASLGPSNVYWACN